jgi:beta-lactam-binding protein with PASTA domain
MNNENPPIMRSLLLNLLAMVLLAAIIIMIVFNFYLPSITNHGEEITVPDLEGKSVTEVTKILRDLDMFFEVVDTIDMDKEKYAPWAVVAQFPSASSTVKPNRTLRLTVQSDTRPQVPLPNLIHQSINAAQNQLRAKRLVLGEVTYVNALGSRSVLKMAVDGEEYEKEAFENGKILVQTGTVVDLFVADGLGQQTLPTMVNVLGMTQEEAEINIIGWGLLLGKVIKRPSFKPEGTVIGQLPKVDEEDLRAGQLVTLYISSGSEGLDSLQVDSVHVPPMDTTASH